MSNLYDSKLSSDLKTIMKETSTVSEEPLLAPDADKKPFKAPALYTVILVVLSMSEGYTFGYMNSLVSIFREKKAPSAQLGLITLVLYPIVLAFLGAPIVDRFFSSTLGKRKTYILPCKLLQGLGYLGLSFFIDDAVERLDAAFITYCLLAIGVLQFFEYNALAGLRYELFGPQGAGLVSFTIATGLMIGVFIGYQVFTLLNTDYVCKNILRSDCTSLVNHRELLLVFSATCFVGFFGGMLIKEKPASSKGRKYLSNWKFIKIFFGDAIHRKTIFWLVFCCFGLVSIKDFLSLQMIHKDYGRENTVLISAALTPVGFVSVFVLKKYLRPGNIMKFSAYTILQNLVLSSGAIYGLIKYQGPDQDTLGTVLLVVNGFVDSISPWIPCHFAMVASIVHKEYAATYYSTMQGIVNFGKTIPVTVTVSLLDHVNVAALFAALQLLNILFIAATYKPFVQKIDATPVAEFNSAVDRIATNQRPEAK